MANFFDRMFNTQKFQDELTAKVNASNHRPAFLNMPGPTLSHNDHIRPHQPLSISRQKNQFNNKEHRDWQSKHNPHLNKLTQGVISFLLKKTPYPFMYAEVDINNESTEKENNDLEKEAPNNKAKTVDVREIAKNDSGKPKRDGSSGSKQNSWDGSSNVSPPGMDLFGQGENPLEQHMNTEYYEVRRDLMDKYHTQWLELDANRQSMFQVLRKAGHKGLATSAAAIIRRVTNGNVQYFVFGTNQIIQTKGKGRLIEKILIRWSNWGDHIDTSNQNANKDGDQWFTVGKDCVLWIPFPCEESPLGSSFLQSVWDLGILQQQNRYLQSLWTWNGGIVDRYVRYPNTTDTATKRLLEDHFKRPMLQPGVGLDYPPGMNPENVDKLYQFEIHASQGEPMWDVYNSILNQDSPFPKQFLEGQTETGALGGSAPEENTKKENETMLGWFHILDPIIKDINKVFFDGKEDEFKDVVVIPFIDDLLREGIGEEMEPLPEESKTSKKKLEDRPIEVQVRKKNSVGTAKVNSMTEHGNIYLGNLFSEGWLPQDDGSQEWLDSKTIKEFVESPHTVKEGYFAWEHPETNPMEVKKTEAIGKFKVIGYDENLKQDITEFIIFESDTPIEIDTSPAYYSRDVTRSDGTIEQTAIDLRNAVATVSPRSMGRTKATKL